MTERRKIIELWRRARRDDTSAILVTLVRAEGSSYRRPGARLLLASDGMTHAGTLSGGCLEAEVMRKAGWMIRGGAHVERYSMVFDDTAEIPFGLGCGGQVDLLFEPVQSAEGEALLQAIASSLEGDERTVISFLPERGRGLRRLVLNASGEIIFQSKELTADKIACAARLTPGEEYEGRFVERLEAPPRLFVLGAGDDARPVVELAASVGFAVTVADGRRHFARQERFEQAQQVLALGENLEGAAQRLGIAAADSVVVMTHSYEQDRALLMEVLPIAPRYLGLLGARHRSSLLVSEAALMLGLSVAECCSRLFAPVGLDLGGDGPEAIALAIVAEIHGVWHGRLKGPLRLSAEEVAQQINKGGASRYLQVQCAMDDAF